jgi:mannosyl-oligosaccharide alpha-1,2-mannosidase
VLRYLYLTFDDPNRVSLDDWVFNTEAHPLRAPAAKATYTAGTLPDFGSPPFETTNGDLPEISPAARVPKPLKDLFNNI